MISFVYSINPFAGFVSKRHYSLLGESITNFVANRHFPLGLFFLWFTASSLLGLPFFFSGSLLITVQMHIYQ